MAESTKRPRVRKPAIESFTPPLSSAEHLATLHARAAGKTILYQVDAWTQRFVRSPNGDVWLAKGFFIREGSTGT